MDTSFQGDRVQVKQEPNSPENKANTSSPPTVKEEENQPQIKREKLERPESSSSEEESSDSDGQYTGVRTHKAALEEFKDGLMELIIGDEILNDLPTTITLEEVNSMIALEHGQAITVNVRRADNVVLPLAVVQNGTVLDLKKAIQRHVMLKQHRENGMEHISWRYTWKKYWLYFQGQKLMEDHKTMTSYGIGNRDEVTFIKRLKKK